MDNLVFSPATIEHWDDLELLFGSHGAYSNCWCMYWRLARSEFDRQTPEERRAGFKALVKSANPPGIIGWRGGEPVAWCSVDRRDSYPPLGRSRVLKPIDGQDVWSIVCFFIAKPHRGHGVMADTLRAAVECARDRGARIVEGYPVDAEPGRRLAPASGYTGIMSAFEKLGFVEVARRSPSRPIMRIAIDPV